MRILDFDGVPSHTGRVEFRINGKWGSVCKKKISASAGKMVCITLGYLDGVIKNPNDDAYKGFCKSFLGKNYCGPDYDPIFY